MNKINWEVRLQSKEFWMATIAFVGLVAQYICKWFGLEFDLPGINAILSSVLGLLVLLGVVIDPTTPNAADSKVTQEKMSIDESAEQVVARTLSNDDLADVLSKTNLKEDTK